MNDSVFSASDYRKAIRIAVDNRKAFGEAMTYQSLASSMRVPKSYLSKVLHGHANLNSDQLHLACAALALCAEESAFLQLLLEHARCSLKARKSELVAEIKRMQGKALQSAKHITAREPPSDFDAESYYLDPWIQMIHVGLTIEKFRKEPKMLAAALGLSNEKLFEAIRVLVKLGLVEKSERGFRVLVETMHLSPDARVYRAWRTQLRLLSLHRLNALDSEKSYSFSVVFSADEETRREIQARFLKFLAEAEVLCSVSPKQGLFQLSFDLLPWG